MKRLPKGLGTVYKMTGARAKPYCAAITTSVPCESEKQKQTPIGYTKTREEGIRMLYLYHYEKLKLLPSVVISNPLLENKYIDHIMKMMEANVLSKNPTEVDNIDIINQLFLASLPTDEITTDNSKISMLKKANEVPTFNSVFQNILFPKYSNKSKSLKKTMKSAHNKLKKIWNRKINTLTLIDYQSIFDETMKEQHCEATLRKMKKICKDVSEYAESNDYISKDYTKFVFYEATSNNKKTKTPFTEDEINLLISDNTFESNIILVYIFTGMRPIEFISIKKNDIHLKERYMIGGAKTESGKNRVIPIHNKIYTIIENLYNNAHENERVWFSDVSLEYAYEKYLTFYKETMVRLNIQHHRYPYDTRHTFITLAEKYELKEILVKRIVGHASGDITKDIYTHPEIDRIVNEINKIIC